MYLYPKKGGYAEDSNYVDKLTSIAEQQRGMKPGTPGEVPTYERPATAYAQNNPSKKLDATKTAAGTILDRATTEFTDTLRLMGTIAQQVTNVTNNNTQASTPTGGQSQGKLPSVYDDIFLNLFQRVT